MEISIKVYKGFDLSKEINSNIKFYNFVQLKDMFGINYKDKTGLKEFIDLISEDNLNIDYETHIYLDSKGTYNFFSVNIDIIVNNLYSNKYPLGNFRNPDNLYKNLESNNTDIECYSEISKINEVYFASFLPTSKIYKEQNIYLENKEIIFNKTFEIRQDSKYIDNRSDLDYFSYLIDTNQQKSNKVDYKVNIDIIPNQLYILKQYFNISINLLTERVIFSSPRPELKLLLQDTYGYDDYRSFKMYITPDENMKLVDIRQDNIIEDIIQQGEIAIDNFGIENDIRPKNIFVTAPTGTGKSLMFILPALYLSYKYKDAITIVITPIKSLMEDQVENYFKDTGLTNSAFINGDLSIIERQSVITKIDNREIDILYLSPELLISKSDITDIIGTRKIALMIVDEAHIVTTWGQGFRPDYWYLGEYLFKLKNASYNKDIPDFPIIAFTATAVYSPYTVDGMVEDICSSLKITGTKKYLGKAVREDISFDITSNSISEVDSRNTDEYLYTKAIEQCIESIKKNTKTLIYVPYRSHANNLMNKLLEINSDYLSFMGIYTSDGDKYDKRKLIRDFKSGEKIIVIATKAFGMGVDINDIKLVYHFAPTGTLCDYVQEVGRAARKQNMDGFAKIKYVNQMKSLKYDNQLFGMSGIKQFEIFAVMRKIISHYDKKHSQNMVVSINDFASAFDPEFTDGYDESVVESKIKTILMMIKKHFEITISRFPVLMARPSSMFTMQYIKVENMITFKKHIFSKYSKNIEDHIFVINLKKIWEVYYENLSFGQFKRILLIDKVVHDCDTKMQMFRKTFTPYVHLNIEVNNKQNSVNDCIDYVLDDFDFIYGMFSNNKIKKETTELSRVKKLLMDKYNDSIRAELITNNIPSILNGLLSLEKQFSSQAQVVSYVKSKNAYRVVYSSLEKAFRNLFNISKKLKSRLKSGNSTYLSVKELKRIQPILSLMDLMGYANYYTIGGDSPEIQIRLNGVSQFRASLNKREGNILLKKVQKRHHSSRELLEYFFNELSSNDERRQLIEYYFVGKTDECKELFEDQRKSRIIGLSSMTHINHKKYGMLKIIEISEDKERITVLIDGKVKKIQNNSEFFNIE